MPPAKLTRLDQYEQTPERRFANPEHSYADVAILEYMRARLRETLGEAAIALGDPLQRELSILSIKEDGERLHRLVILSRQQLLAAAGLTVVGFFGHKRGSANPKILADVDTDLLQEFFHHTYVLSYSSLELPDGNWANLVIMLDATGIEHWRVSQKHAYAARELAPLFYKTVRLHNGVLPGGLAAPQLVLLRTKYYDYSGDNWWLAIREFRSDV
jgi:hypothetical protein